MTLMKPGGRLGAPHGRHKTLCTATVSEVSMYLPGGAMADLKQFQSFYVLGKPLRLPATETFFHSFCCLLRRLS